jgi:hypothetical protein
MPFFVTKVKLFFGGSTMIITMGNHYNTHCPFCGRNNVYICDGGRTPSKKEGDVVGFWKTCHYCKELVYYLAERKGKDKAGFSVIGVFAYTQYPDMCIHI